MLGTGNYRSTGVVPQEDGTPQEHSQSSYSSSAASFFVLGTRVNALQIPDVQLHMKDWIVRRDACHYIAFTGMHGVMEAEADSQFRAALAHADLVVPDGMPLVWVGRLRGHTLPRRVYGPELMLAFCRETSALGYRHYLYGGNPGVPERLAAFLEKSCPGIRIVGTYSPPFRPLTPDEETAIIATINQAAPHVLWIGLSTPKQELWMHQHCERLRVPVMAGVGAAFDFLSSGKKQAPFWMREHGLEWLFRICQEPRRLWRRYLVSGAEFIYLITLELLGLRRWE